MQFEQSPGCDLNSHLVAIRTVTGLRFEQSLGCDLNSHWVALGHALGVAIRGESCTRHCTWGCLDPPTPSPKGRSSEILPAGIGAIIRTLHNRDRCFFCWPDPALTGLYPERGEGGAIGD